MQTKDFEMKEYRKLWRDQGYLVLRNAFESERVARLLEIGERAYAHWKEASSEGSEPGNFHYHPQAWIITHLNHPKYHRQDSAGLAFLLNAIADPLVLNMIGEIFQEPATFMQANYYIDPPGEAFAGVWHRDCQFLSEGDEERERADLFAEADPPRELHLHIPLVATAATEVVPGSHLRWDTPEEYSVRRSDPVNGNMPEAMRLQLHPGDLAFFHTNTLHRGNYPVGVPRRTIAVSYGRVSMPRLNTEERMGQWKGYVSTYQPWFKNSDYLDGVTGGARAFYERFKEVYGPSWKPEYLVPELGEKRIAYFRDYVAANQSL